MTPGMTGEKKDKGSIYKRINNAVNNIKNRIFCFEKEGFLFIIPLRFTLEIVYTKLILIVGCIIIVKK